MMRSLSLPSRLARTSCSVLALATVLVVGATPAAAQSFLGVGTPTNGAATTITTGAGTTNITVTTQQTVINWVPTDNAIANNTGIAFQNSGTTATFSGAGNYAVLNRINPADSTRMIVMDGIIQTSPPLGVPGANSGSIYFYTPGGFVLGANSSINVGSLVLSASDIMVTGGNFINGPENTVVFGQATQAGAQIATIAGSQITANGADAYVAMVAPRVQHGGTITVSGSAALVGAEAATINFSPDGLFDIQVTAGSTDANGVYNDGNITGSAGSGPGDIHRAYLVAVPKNAAMTMLITTGSDLGFNVADAADVVGNTVVLSAGHDIANGSISGVSAGSTGAAIANLDVRDSTFTSAMIGEATGTAFLSGYAALKFYSSVAVHADGEVWLSTQLPGGSVDVDGSLSLSTEQFGGNGEDVTSSAVRIFNLNGGSINVDGATTIDTDAWGGWSGVAGVNGGDATGGYINVMANNGGSIALLGGLTASADGHAGGAFDAGVDGGVGTGGQVLLRTAGAASTLTVNNGVTISSSGYGGSGTGGECLCSDGDGGTGQGGDIRIIGQTGTGSTLTINGNVSAVADGFGGAASDANATAGFGYGGNAEFFVGTGNVMSLTGSLLLQAEGTGGNHFGGGIGGYGFGGEADITGEIGATSGTITITGNVEISSDGEGGDSAASPTGGGDGYGGESFIFSDEESITINGSVNLHSTGTGGYGTTGAGGDGYGGVSQLTSYNLISITDGADVSADGVGGNGALGGDAYGGDIYVRAQFGGTLELLGGTNFFSANAVGGAGNSGAGGDAYGWDIRIYADGVGSNLTISGATTATADATGGASESGVGGEAHGGDVEAYAQNSGSLTFEDDLTATTDAEGGIGATGGGDAYGGDTSIYSFASLQIDGALTARANATGGGVYFTDSSGFFGGDAYGGEVRVFAANGALIVGGAVDLKARGTGGDATNSADFAGDGTGGKTFVYANSGGTIDFQSSLVARADGFGGDGGIGGNGKGGAIAIQANGANASVTVAGATELDALGRAADGGGGNGTGGLVVVEAFGAATASLNFLSDLGMYADGHGGDGYYGSGGYGQGGEVRLTSTEGTTITVGGNAWLNSGASGGDTYDSASSGGNAVGGTSRIETFGTGGLGGTIAIAGNADVAANGYGGGAHGAPSGQGGDGTGGSAEIRSTLGTITIGDEEVGGSATVSADGYGGFAAGGVGGDGFGGDFAVIEADGGDITIYGSASVSTNGTGGYGAITGGDGLGSGTPPTDIDPGFGGAHIYARNGDIVIGGGALVSSFGTGGGGLNVGGDGGNGTGGWATIHAANSDLGPSSITIIGNAFEGSGYAQVNVSGTGGNGGNGNAGGDGGNGGVGRGGNGSITAAAGNGTVTIDSANVLARGDGGHGGDGDNFAGGDGGDGGDGLGGNGTIGTVSGNSQPTGGINLGFGDYGSITVDSSAVGGFGGRGNFGVTNGNGGDGGDAVGGSALLLVRGSRVDVDYATLSANATGGDGGSADGDASHDGNGGNATVGGDGGIAVLVTGRYLIPAHRGTLNGGTINGTAIAIGGAGLTVGTSQNLGGSGVVFLNADGDIDSLDFLVQADSNTGVDSISVINGEVVVDGEFGFDTTGNLSLFADNGDMHAGILTLGAGDFVFDPTTLTDRGTYFADSATITTGNNFVTSADLVIGSSLVIDAPGLINAHNFGIDGDLDLIAQGGGITANDLYVTGAINLDAFDAIDLNLVQAGFFHADAGTFFTSSDITSDSNIQINAGGDVTLGEVVAGVPAGDSSKAIRIIADGSVLAGNILSVGGIDITALGSITGGNVITGDVMFADALGAIIFGNVSAGLVNPQPPTEPFSVGLVSGVSINVGTIDALLSIALVTPGTLTSGNLTTTTDVIGLVDGNMSIGDVTADGRVLLADYSMYTDAGGTIPTSDGFNPEDIFAASLVATSGSITIGDVLAGSFKVAAGTFIDVGAIDAGNGAVTLLAGGFIGGDIVEAGSIYAESGDYIFLGNLTAPGDIELVAVGDISIGNATAGESIDLEAGGSVDGGTMTAGDSVYVEAGDYVDLLNISAGFVDPSIAEDADYNVGILAGTTIETGNIAAFNSIGLGAAGNIYTGSIDAGDIFLALGGGNMSFGTINADGTTYLADDSMIPLGGDLSEEGDFDPAPILAATPVVSGGSITLRGSVITGKFVAAASGAISGSTIDSDTSIYAESGGNQSFTDLDAGTAIYQRALGTITENDLIAGSFIDIRSGGAMSLGDLLAGDYIDLRSNNAINLLTALSGETINFQTLGSLTGLSITAGNSVLGQAVGAIQLGNISAGISDPSSVPGAGYRVGLASDGTITTGAINALGNVGFGTPQNVTTGNLTSGGGIMALIGGNASFGAMTTGSGGYVYLGHYSMSPLGGAFETFNRAPILALFPAATGGSITITGPVTTGNFRAAAGTTFNAGNIASTTNILIDSGGNMTLGDLVAGLTADGSSDAIGFNSGGSILMGNATALDGIDFDAEGSVTGGNLTTGGEIGGGAEGAIILGNLSAGIVNPQGPSEDGFSIGVASATSITVGNVIGADSVGFATLGSITTGTIHAGNDFLVMASGNMSFGAINAGGRVYLADGSMYVDAGGDSETEDEFNAELVFAATPVASGGSITAGAIDAGSVQAAAGTTFTSGEINADNQVALSSGGAMQLQDVTVGTSLRLTSGATIDGGDLTAGTLVRVSAVGAVDVGDIIIDGGIQLIDGFQIFDVGSGSPVEVFGASIVTGNIGTDGYVGLYTPGDLSVGTIDAGHDVIALVGDDAAFAAIATPERFFLGGYQMFALVTGGEGFNPEAVFDAEQKGATGGSATFAGSSSAGSFEAYVGDDTTLASLSTDDFALIDTGGMFTLSGALNGDSRVISNDIAIGATAAINGELHLISRNASQTLIGDGLDGLGQGYRLSDAEADRINAAFTIAADTSYGAAAKMIIGDLSIIADGDSESELEYGFGTINRDSDDPSVGSIKIVGDVTFSGLGQFDGVDFDTNLFELDAATGSLTLYGQGTTLGGELGLYAPRVWVASGDILAKLEANSTYSGYIAELNAPAAVQRPEGVLRAASFDIDSGEEQFQSFLVQNTGTAATPAGFVIDGSDLSDDEGSDDPPGSINLVINGQIITEGGTLTGIAARDLLVSEVGSAQFAAGSTVNGCVLVGPCIVAPPPPPPKIDTPVRTDVQLNDNSGLGDGLFGNEGDIDDGESGDEGDRSSPISPPNPLFDSRPLVQSGDVDDPVSGAGNPSLYGSPGEDEDDEEETKKKAKQGDGK